MFRQLRDVGVVHDDGAADEDAADDEHGRRGGVLLGLCDEDEGDGRTNDDCNVAGVPYPSPPSASETKSMVVNGTAGGS